MGRGEMQWFRLYNRIVDDEKLRLLAFEDRWHFVALCCLQSSGLLDEPDSDLRNRRIAVKLGVQVRELDEISRRLREVNLIDETLHPIAWDDLQFRSDNSTARVQKYREKQQRNGKERLCNVSETDQEAETETDISPKGDCPSDDEPALKPIHVFEGYQELAQSLGRPVPRDFTPSRRAAVRSLMSKYTLQDFQTVFAKCRDSPWLRGEKGKSPLTFDFIMQPRIFQRALEGNYDD